MLIRGPEDSYRMESQEQPPFSHLLSIRVTSPSDNGLGEQLGAPDPRLSSEHGTASRQIVARSRQAAQVAPTMAFWWLVWALGSGCGLWGRGACQATVASFARGGPG